MAVVNASDFQKRIGEYTDIARREPVTVTRHGRASVVLLAAEDYNRLKMIEERAAKAIKIAELPEEWVEAVRGASTDHLPSD
jgi:prevent-host-death family protein